MIKTIATGYEVKANVKLRCGIDRTSFLTMERFRRNSRVWRKSNKFYFGNIEFNNMLVNLPRERRYSSSS